MLLLIVFFGIFLILSAGQPGQAAPIAVNIIGPATPYPTHTPYRTARPYRQPTAYNKSTPYPTIGPYPTTGLYVTQVPRTDRYSVYVVPNLIHYGGCRVSVKNQNSDRDSMVIIIDKESNEILRAIFVRANDSESISGIKPGTYLIYVALGLDWDAQRGQFLNFPTYFRFEDEVVFETCNSGLFSTGYQYINILLHIVEGEGSDTLYVPLDGFPNLSE